MTRVIAVLCLLLLSALCPTAPGWIATANAQDLRLRERVIEAMREKDLEAAVAVLHGGLNECKTVEDFVEGVFASLDLVPSEVGNRLATRYANRALIHGTAKDPEAWKAAMAVRRRINEERDIEVGEDFLELLMGLYEEDRVPLSFRYDLAGLLLDAGRQREALEAYEDILTRDPAQADAALKAAQIREDRGDVDGAIAVYDRFLAGVDLTTPGEGALLVQLNLAMVRLHTERDFDQAEKDLTTGREALGRLRGGAVKDRLTSYYDAETEALAERRRHAVNVRERIGDVERALAASVVFLLVLLAGGVLLGRRQGVL